MIDFSSLLSENGTRRSQASQSTIDSLPFSLVVTDSNGRILESNRQISRAYGFEEGALVGRSIYDILTNASKILLESYVYPYLEREQVCSEVNLFIKDQSGQRRAVVGFISNEEASNQKLWCFFDAFKRDRVFRELTESRAILEKKSNDLNKIAHTDILTGLPNRAHLTEHLRDVKRLSDDTGSRFAVAFIDLDGFKDINDTYGHPFGDRFLSAIAERLRVSVGEDNFLSRYGGDEFILVAVDIQNGNRVEALLERVIETINVPIEIDGICVNVSASIGVSVYPQPLDVQPDQLIRQADQSMYQAKLNGKNRILYFNPISEIETTQISGKLSSITLALREQQFELYFQPKIDLASGLVVGAEALIRWNHPERGVVSPAEFLPVIQDTELEIEVGKWVLFKAAEQIGLWKERGIHTNLSINISGNHLQSTDFLEMMQQIVADNPFVDHSDITLEVLETSAIEDVEQVASVIKRLAAEGFHISLDDFGTGYSTLSHLVHLPVTEMKIDKSFVMDMFETDGNISIIKGIIGFARAFGLLVVAEGVETQRHAKKIRELGCDVAQGYFISRPMDANSFASWYFDAQKYPHKKVG